MISFIDRKEELSLLENDWSQQENAFVVVYGRRRIGKTRLISEFLKDKEGVKYTASDTNKKVQLDELKGIIANYLHDDFLSKQEILEWDSLFSYLSKVVRRDKRFYLWIDEFSYLVKNDSAVASAMQKFIDEFVRDSHLFLMVSGSLFGLMSEKVLSNSSPLYGRRTRALLLGQIPSVYIRDFVKFRFEDVIKVTLTVGGISEYLLVARKFKDYDSFIKAEFLNKEGYFYREPFFLLAQEFKEIKTYFSILNAIAYGNSRPTEIANFVGLDAREIYPYLELLISYGFVGRETSILMDRKGGVYYIKDNFLDFWFNFVHKHREELERDVYHSSKEELNRFLGRRFEILVRDNFHLFFPQFKKVGRWWNRGEEIDVVALNDAEVMFGECKWKEEIDPLKILFKLRGTSEAVAHEARRRSWVIFAKSFTRKVSEWEGEKVFCVDMTEMERVWNETKNSQ